MVDLGDVTWAIRIGTETRTATPDDVDDALLAAQSCLLKEMSDNRVIKENEHLKAQYDKHYQILTVLRKKFVYAVEAQHKKIVHPTIPRTRK